MAIDKFIRPHHVHPERSQTTINDAERLCFIQNKRKPGLIQVEHSLTALLLFPHYGAFAKSSPQEPVLHLVSHVIICLGLARINSANSDASQHSHRKTCPDSSGSSFCSPPVYPCCLDHFVFFFFIYSELSLTIPWFMSDLFNYL